MKFDQFFFSLQPLVFGDVLQQIQLPWLGSPNGARPGCSLVPQRWRGVNSEVRRGDSPAKLLMSKSKENRMGSTTYQLVQDVFQQYDTTCIRIYIYI